MQQMNVMFSPVAALLNVCGGLASECVVVEESCLCAVCTFMVIAKPYP